MTKHEKKGYWLVRSQRTTRAEEESTVHFNNNNNNNNSSTANEEDEEDEEEVTNCIFLDPPRKTEVIHRLFHSENTRHRLSGTVLRTLIPIISISTRATLDYIRPYNAWQYEYQRRRPHFLET